MSRSHGGLKVLTVNVNGLGCPGRARVLLHFLTVVCSSPDIIILQELKLPDSAAVTAALAAGRGQGLPYHAACYDNCGSSLSRGVAVLVKLHECISDLPDAPSAVDADGRVVRVDFSYCNTPMSVLSVYAPNRGRAAFFESVRAFIPSNRECVIGGDFNCILEPMDQTSTGLSRFNGSLALKTLMHDHSLVDAYRSLNPDGKEFTHTDTHRASSARLDRFLISSACSTWVQSVKHMWGAPGDHAAVLMHMHAPGQASMGPGLLSFPCLVLFHDEYREALEAALVQRITGLPAADPAMPGSAWTQWEHIKAITLDIGQRLGAHHMRKQLKALRPALQSVAAAVHRLGNEPQSAAARHALLAEAHRLREVVTASSNRLSEASAAMWRTYGEKPSAWHFAQSGPKHKRAPISTLCDVSGKVYDMSAVHSGAELHDLVSEHFSSAAPAGLFRAGAVDTNAQHELLAGVESLSVAQALAADGPHEDGTVTESCVMAALTATASGKAPGRDGLPYEVYKHLWGTLGAPLVAALNDIFHHGPPAGSSWADGIILPIYKGKGLPHDRLASYRPITLLNTDNKLAQRLISDRLQQPLSQLVSPEQTAFLSGRDIANNVLATQSLADYLEEVQQPGVMIVLDIKQAYDRVDRGWVHQVAAAMGLPPGMRTWFQRFMQSCTGRVLINGHTTPAFPVDNGLPQGGPLAPTLWALQLQPLTTALARAQAAGLLRSPLLPDGSQVRPISHHADDSKLLLCDLHTDAPPAMRIIRTYCSASNALMHDDKAQGHCMGSHPRVEGQDPITKAHFSRPGDPPMVSLGVPVTTDLARARELVYAKRVQAVHGVAARWRAIPLSMTGRVLNAKQQMGNTLCYHVSYVPPDFATIKTLDHAITQYIARSHLPEDLTISGPAGLQLLPKNAIAVLPRHHGGLSAPDIPSQIISLQAKIVASAFSPGAYQWKQLLLRDIARAAPHPGWGPAWLLLASVPMTGISRLPLRVQHLLSAFRDSLPSHASERVVLPYRACLLEPLFHNPAITASTGAVFVLPEQVPDGWPFFLGQLASCPAAVRADPRIRAVEARLPARWRQALEVQAGGEETLRQHDTWMLHSASGLVVQWSPELQQARRVYRALPCGGLVVMDPEPADLSPLEPACVLAVPKPRRLWSESELAEYEAAPHAERHLHRPTEPRLLGPWSAVRVYPSAWMHSAVPLNQYSCAAVRMHLSATHAAPAVRDHMPDYVIGAALRPRLWSAPVPTRRATGLAAIEQEWTQAHQDRQRYRFSAQNATPSRPHPSEAWLHPRPPDYQRRPPRARGHAVSAAADATAEQPATCPRSSSSSTPPAAVPAAGAAGQSSSSPGPLLADAPAPGGAPPPPAVDAHRELPLHGGVAPPAAEAGGPAEHAGPSADGQAGPAPVVGGAGPHLPGGGDHTSSAKYWQLIHRMPVSNNIKVFGVRLAHAALPSRAMVAGMRQPKCASDVRCPRCAALDPRPFPVPSETYTHLFLLCPSYRPVTEWLCSLWESLAGARPPLDPAVIIAAEPDAWPQAPTGARLLAWHALRLTVLYAIWSARVENVSEKCRPSAVARRAVSLLREEIALQFRRSRQSQYYLQFLPPRLLGTHRLRPAEDGFAAWSALGLCTVLGSSSTTSPGGTGHLVVLLSNTFPVPLPADP